MVVNTLKFHRQQIDDLTQVKLAKMVGISEAHYQSLEYGKTEPKVTLAQKLAKALGVEVPDIFPIDFLVEQEANHCNPSPI